MRASSILARVAVGSGALAVAAAAIFTTGAASGAGSAGTGQVAVAGTSQQAGPTTAPQTVPTPAAEQPNRAAAASGQGGETDAEGHFHGPIGPQEQVPDGEAAVNFRAAAGSRPLFQLPFACGTTWKASTYSGHRNTGSVDFNWTGGQDEGKPVLASAAGTVSTSKYLGDRSFGNYIVITHAGGWKTYYAHLSKRVVQVGDTVKGGQLIGNVGNTGNSYGAHLHYEQHSAAGSVSITINGKALNYFGTYTSRNCAQNGTPTQPGTPTPPSPPATSNPYTVSKICGAGYRVIEQRKLDGAVAYLAWNGAKGKNCVTTIKTKNIGKRTTLAAGLMVSSGGHKVDSGKFSYYAGPAILPARGVCVKFSAASGASSFTSEWGHCGS